MLKTSAKAWEKAADIELRERFGLTGAKWKIITVLSIKEGITQKHIADMLFVEAPTLVSVIDKMEKDGYVKRESDSNDRRNNLIFMTKKSKDIVDPIIESILEIRNMGLNKISKKDMDPRTVRTPAIPQSQFRNASIPKNALSPVLAARSPVDSAICASFGMARKLLTMGRREVTWSRVHSYDCQTATWDMGYLAFKDDSAMAVSKSLVTRGRRRQTA